MTNPLTGIESHYMIKNNQKLRLGYTTGTCAAAAAKAAAMALLTGENPAFVQLMTPKGIALTLKVVDLRRSADSGKAQDWVSCGIVKDAGDDPDVTDGLTIYARVKKTQKGIQIDGGEGVGRVTRAGLSQPVGAAAINAGPRQMIAQAVTAVAEAIGYGGGFSVEISVPEGKKIAEKTFNPRLGIVGGISILGTSGVVEPMSEQALLATIETEIKQQIACGRRTLLFTLGNYGGDYLAGLADFPLKESVKCSNYVGQALDMAVACGAEGVLFVAHIGKFIKVAGGIMQTHSREADSRAEIMAACGLRAGLSREAALAILETLTTDEALQILAREGLLQETMAVVCRKVRFYLDHRCGGQIPVEALIFSNHYGDLGETAGYRDMLAQIAKEQQEMA